MGKAKKTRKFAAVKRMLNPKDARLTTNLSQHQKQQLEKKASKDKDKHNNTVTVNGKGEVTRTVSKPSTQLFFKFNTSLGPPYHVLIDTNFINFSIQNKLDVFKSMMDCLLAKCFPTITDCVMAELEKLGPKFRVALRIAKDPRFTRISCTHKGTYADDCLIRRVTQHKCYVVATCDRDLKRRIRKIPGVPIMYIFQRKYSVERFPNVNAAPRLG